MTTELLEAPAVESEAPAADPVNTDAAERYETKLSELASKIVATIEYNGKLAEYVKIGKTVVSLGRMQAKTVQSYDKDDWKRLIDRITDTVLMSRKGIDKREVRVRDYAYVALWVEHVKKLVPEDVANRIFELPYGIVANYLATGDRFTFEVGKLAGEVSDKWQSWTVNAVQEILSDRPFDVPSEIKKKKDEIDKAALAKLDPEEALKREQKAANDKIVAARNKARKDILDALHEGLDHGLKASDVGYLANEAFKDKQVTDLTGFGSTTVKEVGPDPAKLTVDQAREFVLAMLAAQNVKGIIALRNACNEILAPIIQQAAAAAPSKPATEPAAA